MAAVLDQPVEGSLDHPAAWQRLETPQAARTLDDEQRKVGLLLRPVDQFAGITSPSANTVSTKYHKALEARISALGAIPVLHGGGLHLDGKLAALGVSQDVLRAAGDLLARIVAARPPF